MVLYGQLPVASLDDCPLQGPSVSVNADAEVSLFFDMIVRGRLLLKRYVVAYTRTESYPADGHLLHESIERVEYW